MNSYAHQLLAMKRAEIRELEWLRTHGKEVPEHAYNGLLLEIRVLEEDIRMQQRFFPEFDAAKLEKLLSEP